MKDVKIKVKKTPIGNIKPLYNQDAAGGLDAYHLPMVKKDKELEDNISYTEKEVPREDANAELEQGEVVYNPMKEQLTKVGGRKHKAGGTPVDLDAGSFIFSEYLKMSDEEKELLKVQGKEPSYANAISKYIKGFNNSVHILKTGDDKIDKETAALSLEGIKTRMGKVAFLQEASKGFKDGVPELAKGVMQTASEAAPEDQQQVMQGGGLYPQIGRKLSKDEWQSKIDKEGYEVVKSSNGRVAFKKTDKKTYIPQPFEGKKTSNPTDYIKKLVDSDYTYDEALGKGYIDNSPQWKTEWQKNNGRFDTQTTGDLIYYDEGQAAKSAKRGAIGAVQSPNNPSTHPDDPLNTYDNPFTDSGYGLMDGVSMAAPFNQPIKRNPPIRQHVNAEQLNYRPQDYTAQRQAIMGQVKTLSDATDLTSPSSSVASARKAGLVAQVLDPLNQSFMQEFNTNQQGFSQVEAQNAQSRQQANMFNAQQDDVYNTKYAQMNENFDARKAQRFSQFLNAWQGAEKQRQVRNLFNYMNEDFKIGPNQEIYRDVKSTDQMMQRITGQGNSGHSDMSSYGDLFSEVGRIKEAAKRAGQTVSDEQALSLAKSRIPNYTETFDQNTGAVKSTSRSSKMLALNNALQSLIQ